MEPTTHELAYPPKWLESALDPDDMSVEGDEIESGDLGYI